MALPTVRAQTGAHLLLTALEARGTRYLFGVPGHGAYPIYDALSDVPALTPIVGRHEQSSLFSALGYAWASGRVAVATSVPEAGLTNAATGLLEATGSQERLLFLIEENPMHRDVLRSIARHNRRADSAAALVQGVHALLDQLEHGRPGAAVLEIPNRVLAASADEALVAERPPAPLPPLPAGIAEAAQRLRAARRRVILAGAAANDAGATVQALAERLAAPVLVDGLTKGLLPEDHPLALGPTWSPTGPPADLIAAAEAILVIGAPLGGGSATAPWLPRMVTGGRPPEAVADRLLLIDWDDQAHAALPGAPRLHGHVPTILSALLAALPPDAPAEGFAASDLDAVRRRPWEYAAERVPWAVPFFQQVSQALPRDGILVLDSLIGLWLDRLVPAYRPRSVRFPHGTGTLGFGTPAAVGARLAWPDREVVAVAGDGAFLFNAQELASMRLYDQKLTVVVANDDCYGAIKHNMTENFGRATAYRLVNPDFIRLGEAYGMRALRLERSDQIGAALQAALAGDQPTLIEVPLELMPPRGFYT
jgi:acetolactate synthase-1/2/3 large subunit